MRKINAYEILLHIYDHTGYVCTILRWRVNSSIDDCNYNSERVVTIYNSTRQRHWLGMHKNVLLSSQLNSTIEKLKWHRIKVLCENDTITSIILKKSHDMCKNESYKYTVHLGLFDWSL